VHPRPSPWIAWRTSPSSGSSCPLAPGGIFSQWSGGGDAPQRQGRWRVTISAFPANKPPRNVVGISSWDAVHWGSLARSYILLCQHRLSGLVSKDWAWEQRSLTLYTFASRLQKLKARFNPYMIACNSIDYFSPSATWPSSCFNSLFYLSAMPSLPPATLSEHKLVHFFFLVLLPTTGWA
jgi:hypothetical protein